MDILNIKQKLKKLERTSFGISIPELRKLAKQIAKTDYKMFIQKNDYSSYELKLLHAFVIGYAKDDIQTLLGYFKNFIPFVNDWVINDSLCQNFKIARKFPEKVWNFLMTYRHTSKEFESRIVSVMLLSHYITDDYIDSVIAVLDSLNTQTYYSRMGVAWGLATIMGKYPSKCIKYLSSDNCHLDIKTYNKTLQKIRESYKVSDDIKSLIKEMKKI